MIKQRVLICGLCLLMQGPAFAVQSGGVAAKLDALAAQIVSRSQAADLNAVAVLPFRNADGTCSVLSNFLVDELILSLFKVPDSTLQIVERSQLEAIIVELKLGEGGLLKPETTKQLGQLSGVEALIVGTIALMGEAVRVNARLIDTATGLTVSAAAENLPLTPAISDLLQQPLAAGNACEAPTKSQDRMQYSRESRTSPPIKELSDRYVQSAAGVEFSVTGTKTTSAGFSVSVEVVNRSDSMAAVIVLTNSYPSMLDYETGAARYQGVSGIGACNSSLRTCVEPRFRHLFASLPPGVPVPVLLKFYTESVTSGALGTLQAAFGIVRGDKSELMTFVAPNVQIP